MGCLCPAVGPRTRERVTNGREPRKGHQGGHGGGGEAEELGLFILETRRLSWALMEALLPEGSWMDGRARVFCEELSNRARAVATGCMRGDADWRQGKKVFPVQVVRHWKRLSRAVVHPPSVGVFKPWLDEALSNLV